MATDPTADYGTFTRTHPVTGQEQTRTAESPGDAVQMRFIGWREVTSGANKTDAPKVPAPPRNADTKP